MQEPNSLRPVRFTGKLYSGQVRVRHAQVECVFPAEVTQVEFVYDPYSVTVVTRDMACAAAVGRMLGQQVRLQIGEPGATRIQTDLYLLDVNERRAPNELTLWLSKSPPA